MAWLHLGFCDQCLKGETPCKSRSGRKILPNRKSLSQETRNLCNQCIRSQSCVLLVGMRRMHWLAHSLHGHLILRSWNRGSSLFGEVSHSRSSKMNSAMNNLHKCWSNAFVPVWVVSGQCRLVDWWAGTHASRPAIQVWTGHVFLIYSNASPDRVQGNGSLGCQLRKRGLANQPNFSCWSQPAHCFSQEAQKMFKELLKIIFASCFPGTHCLLSSFYSVYRITCFANSLNVIQMTNTL